MIGVDWGERRIGVAVSMSGELASPHSVLRSGPVDEVTEKLARLASELEGDLFVLGVPAGRRHDRAEIASRFEQIADRLRQKSCKTVVLWDESYTTAEAASLRRAAGKNWKRYKEEIDKEAAAVMLQSYLDHEKRRRSSAE